MPLFVGLDVSLKMTSICIVEADGSVVWEGKVESEPVPLVKALSRWRKKIRLVGIEACPLSEWLYGALVECKFTTVCIETRHAQRFLSSRPNKTDRSDARGIADMMRLGHYRPVHVKSKASQLLRTTLIARKKFVDHMLAIEDTIRGLLKVYGLKIGAVHRWQRAVHARDRCCDAGLERCVLANTCDAIHAWIGIGLYGFPVLFKHRAIDGIGNARELAHRGVIAFLKLRSLCEAAVNVADVITPVALPGTTPRAAFGLDWNTVVFFGVSNA